MCEGSNVAPTPLQEAGAELALAAILSPELKLSKKYKKGVLTRQQQVVHHVPETYMTDDVVIEMDNDKLQIIQQLSTNVLKPADSFCMKTLRILHDYDEYVLKASPRKDQKSIRQHMRSFWSHH